MTSKRRDLLDGALGVFATDGYARASIDGIARAAGVSSRTIYNQFGDKAGLFEAVIVDSATRVADVQVVEADRLLGAATDAGTVDSALVAFGRAWAVQDPRFAPHFALVRQVQADTAHVPDAALDAWREAGPLRVRRAIAAQLRRIADAGLLDIDDPELAAGHLVSLAAAEAVNRAQVVGAALSRAEVHRLADAGVRVFLRGYRPDGVSCSAGPAG